MKNDFTMKSPSQEKEQEPGLIKKEDKIVKIKCATKKKLSHKSSAIFDKSLDLEHMKEWTLDERENLVAINDIFLCYVHSDRVSLSIVPILNGEVILPLSTSHFQFHSSSILQVEFFSPQSNELCTIGRDGLLLIHEIWKPETNEIDPKLIFKVNYRSITNSTNVFFIKMHWNPLDKNSLLAISTTEILIFLRSDEEKTPRQIKTIPFMNALNAQFSPFKPNIVTAITGDGFVHVLDWMREENYQIKQFRPFSGNEPFMSAFCSNEGGLKSLNTNTLYLTANKGRAKLWNIFSKYLQNVTESAECLHEVIFDFLGTKDNSLFYFDLKTYLLLILRKDRLQAIHVKHTNLPNSIVTKADLEPQMAEKHEVPCFFDFFTEMKITPASSCKNGIKIVGFESSGESLKNLHIIILSTKGVYRHLLPLSYIYAPSLIDEGLDVGEMMEPNFSNIPPQLLSFGYSNPEEVMKKGEEEFKRSLHLKKPFQNSDDKQQKNSPHNVINPEQPLLKMDDFVKFPTLEDAMAPPGFKEEDRLQKPSIEKPSDKYKGILNFVWHKY